VELLWSIEGHAAECTVTRPTLLPDRRRSLLARWRPDASLGYSPGDASGPRVVASASCVIGDEAGARVVTRRRLAAPLDDVASRDGFVASLPFDARWVDAPCDEISCDWRVLSQPAPDVVEIVGETQGFVDVTRPDVRRVLAGELGSRPGVFEASVVHVGGTNLSVLEVLERIPRGVGLSTRILGSDEALGLAESELLDALLARLSPHVTRQELGWRVRGDVFERFLPMPWALVEAEVADDEIERETRLRRARRDRVVPYDEIVLDDPRALRRQAGARARALRVSRDPERRTGLARERALLLLRLFELTDESPAAVEAISLLLEIGEVDRARVEAERALALRPGDAELRGARFRTVASDAALLDAAIAAMRPDLAAVDRRDLARIGARALGGGVGWGTIEASFEVARSGAQEGVSPLRGVSVPLGSLVELGYLLLRARGASGPLTVRAAGALRAEAPDAIELLAVRWPSARAGATVWAAVPSPSPTLARLRWLSAALRAQLPEGSSGAGASVEVTVSMGDQVVTLRVGAGADEGELLGVSRPLARAPWEALVRDVARPVAALEATRFPLPVLTSALAPDVRARVAARLVEARGGALDGGVCDERGEALVCVGRERGAEALLDVLAIIAADALGIRPEE
jgi:hypothetical protein